MNLRLIFPALVYLGFVLGSTNAQATLLFSGGDDIDFICNSSGGCGAVSNASGPYRQAWAHEAYVANGGTGDPPPNRFGTPPFPASSTLWVHAQFCNSGNACQSNSTTANVQMLRIFDSIGNPTLIVRGTGVSGQLKISSRTSAGVITDLVTCSSAFNSLLTQLDLFINYGSSGEITLYNNSVAVCDFTGNVTNGDGATTLNQAEFSGAQQSFASAWSEVIIATTDTRAMARFSANTVNNGTTVGFSGTNICSSIWNVINYNDANFGFTGSNNILHECTVNSAVPPGVYTVLGLVMSARALVGSSGPLHFDFVTRTGGTDYFSADFAPTTSFSNIINYIQAVNPATSAAWSISDFQAAGFNVGEESKP